MKQVQERIKPFSFTEAYRLTKQYLSEGEFISIRHMEFECIDHILWADSELIRDGILTALNE